MGSRFATCPDPFLPCNWPRIDTALTTITWGSTQQQSHPLQISAGPHLKFLNGVVEDQRL